MQSDDHYNKLREMKLTKEEENDMFPQIRRNLSEAQMEQMATQFKEAKSTIQQAMAKMS